MWHPRDRFTRVQPFALLAALLTAAVSAGAAELTDADQVLAPTQLRMQPLAGDAQAFQARFGRPNASGDPTASIAESDLNYTVRNWPLMPPNGKSDQAFLDAAKEDIKKFIAEHRATRLSTGLHPALMWDRDGDPANGTQPLVAPGLDAGRAAMLARPGLAVENPTFLADNQITEAQDSDGTSIYRFGKTVADSWFRFDDVKVTYYVQKKPSLPDKGVNSRYPDIEGTRVTDAAVFESAPFLEKYLRLDAPVSRAESPVKFRLTDASAVSVKYSPPGDTAFDPGHEAYASTDARFDKEKMQIYVVASSKMMRAPADSAPVPASAFAPAGRFEAVGERKIYVEDHYPPMPASASDLAQGIRPSGAESLRQDNANLDLNMMEGSTDSRQQPLVRRGFPDPSRGEGLLSSLKVEEDNPNDVNSKSTLNFEIGRSIRHRFRYSSTGAKLGPGVDLSAFDRMILYVPPYVSRDASGGSVVNGPYVGNVDAANLNPEDPYTAPEWLDKYTPIAFDGNLLRAVNYLYEHDTEKVQADYGKTDAGTGLFGFPNTAKILYKSGAECVIGITAHGANLAVPPGALSVPLGFASYAVGDFKASPDADLAQPDLTGKPKSATGGPNDAHDARDSFFKVNAADCCGNEKVLASGTYATADNVRPNIEFGIEEAQIAPGKEERTRWVVGVPNDTAAGSNATAAPYSLDSPHSRVDVGKPVEQRQYGDFSNQAHDWNSADPAGMTNPSDAQGRSFLDITGGGTKPPLLQNHRMMLHICAEDNVGEAARGSKIVYPISHLSFQVIRPDRMEDGGQTLVSASNNASSSPEPPCRSVEYVFHAPGVHQVVITARDLSGNERVMTVAVPIQPETPVYQKMEAEQRRGEY